MPGLDRSGPMGSGPMTGGRRGLCGSAGSGYDMPVGYGRGLGMRRGPRGGFRPGGRGLGRRFPDNPEPYGYSYQASRADEMEMLKAETKTMQESLEAILKRLTELETNT